MNLKQLNDNDTQVGRFLRELLAHATWAVMICEKSYSAYLE